MKMVVLLAVLFAGLLMATGVALAAGCCADQCFKVTGTDLTNPANSFTDDWAICYDSALAVVCNHGGPLFQAALFHELLIFQAISFDSDSKGAYMKFHGADNDIFNGLYYNGTDRFLIHGVEEECDFAE